MTQKSLKVYFCHSAVKNIAVNKTVEKNKRFTSMQSLKDDGIFTSGDEDLANSLGEALFDQTLPLEGEGEESAPIIPGEEEESSAEEF